jgi:cytochrome c-type biogenesis protein CcmE
MSNPPQDSKPTGPSKGAQISAGALVVAALLGWYSYTNLGEDSTFTYYQTLEEFQADGRPSSDRALRVHGYVATASIERDLAERQVRFAVQNDPPHASPSDANATRLSVVYRSLETPDLFKDGAEVVVEGRVGSGSGEIIFVADNVMAKCPSKFEAKAAAGEQMPGARAEAL